MNRTVKILMWFIIIMMTFTGLSFVNAYGVADANGKSTTITGESDINTFSQNAVLILGTIGSIISVVILIVLGIKYMLGSVEEKAEYKKTLLPYIIGAAFVFAASAIAPVIYNLAIKL